MSIELSYAGNKQKLFKIMKMQMFLAFDRMTPTPDIENMRFKLGSCQAYDHSSD
jgi:hypothetical protein